MNVLKNEHPFYFSIIYNSLKMLLFYTVASGSLISLNSQLFTMKIGCRKDNLFNVARFSYSGHVV